MSLNLGGIEGETGSKGKTAFGIHPRLGRMHIRDKWSRFRREQWWPACIWDRPGCVRAAHMFYLWL